jgi:uncharacterized membrane protein
LNERERIKVNLGTTQLPLSANIAYALTIIVPIILIAVLAVVVILLIRYLIHRTNITKARELAYKQKAENQVNKGEKG